METNEPKYTALTPAEQRIWRMGYDKRNSELEPTAGDREAAERISKQVMREVLASAVAGAEDILASREDPVSATEKLSEKITDIFAAALSAARGNRAELEAAARKAISEIDTTIIILNECFPRGHREYQLNECFVGEVKEARDALAAILAERTVR